MTNYTLSIHDGHNASVAFFKDSKLTELVNEERFTNIKNQDGFPIKSVCWILEKYQLEITQIQKIVLPHLNLVPEFKNNDAYSIDRKIYEALSSVIPTSIIASKNIFDIYSLFYGKGARNRQVISYFNKYFNKKVDFELVEHHSAHGYAALAFSNLFRSKDDILVFVSDTSGDGISNSVSLFNSEKGLQRLSETSAYNSICKLYSSITSLLGMKPNEHEYKVMGLAPYVRAEYAENVFKILSDFIVFDNKTGEFRNKNSYGASVIKKLRHELQSQRFDSIAAGTQLLFERLMSQWVNFWIDKTQCSVAVFGGGGFMNVKSNMLLASSKKLTDYYFCPSSGDESTSVGAGYFSILKVSDIQEVPTIKNIYLGREFQTPQVEAILDKYSSEFEVVKLTDSELIVEMIAEGKIISRFYGREEWGARALGHRSILCRPDKPQVVAQLNQSIKSRDFWMPFACSVLDSCANEYFLNYDEKSDEYMMKTYRIKPEVKSKLLAGSHPFDGTCRAQIVRKNQSGDYWSFLNSYYEYTGNGALLNTSFNLHGSPIVGDPEVAIQTVLNSGLKYLWMESFLLKKAK